RGRNKFPHTVLQKHRIFGIHSRLPLWRGQGITDPHRFSRGPVSDRLGHPGLWFKNTSLAA
ncbi:unnamed protein product, partial [Citrullus colocynthis]